MKRALAGPLVIVLLAASAAHPLQAEAEWTKATTPHFELYTTDGEGVAKRTLLYFEQIRSFFLQTMTIERKSQERIRIIGFRNDKEYEPFRPTESAAAYYTQIAGRDTIVIGRIGDEHHQTAVHEYVHLLVKASGADFPPWLSEGTAELYSTLEPFGKKVRIGGLPLGRLRALHELKWIPLERLFEVKHGDPEYSLKKHTGAFYSQSWALTHMLNLAEAYRPKVSEAVRAIANGAGSMETLQQIYGQSPAELEKALRMYANQSAFMVAVYDVRLEKSAEEPVFEPASDLETRLLLTSLIAAQREKAGEAELQLLTLQKDYPDSPEAAEALGDLVLRVRSAQEAVPHFERAAELGGTNPRMYRNLAAMTRGVRERSFQIEMLERAEKLDPDDVETHRILGSLYVQDGQWTKGVLQLNRVKKVKTHEEAYALYNELAYAHYRLNDLDGAEKLAQIARKHAEDPQQTARIELMLQAIARTRDRAAYEASGGTLPQEETAPPTLTDDFERPSLAYNPLPPEGREVNVSVQRKPSFVGGLKQFECLGDHARITVQSGEESRTFLIADPMGIVILRNGEGAPDVSFTCGEQDGRPLEVTYEEDPGGEARVLTLDFLDARQ